ncbi:tyrosine-type recombinase/integrase [Vibrio mediterranei]
MHDLRHTFANYAVIEGYPLPMVAKLLGHQRISSTLRYTHVSDAHVQDTAQYIGDVLNNIVSNESDRPTHTALPKKSNKKKKVFKNRNRTSSQSTLTDEEIRHIRNELDFVSW